MSTGFSGNPSAASGVSNAQYSTFCTAKVDEYKTATAMVDLAEVVELKVHLELSR